MRSKRHSLEICGKYFKLTQGFLPDNEGYSLSTITKERIIKPTIIIPQKDSSIDTKTNVIQRLSRRDLLLYLKNNGLGEYTYLELNFDSIKVVTPSKEILIDYNIVKYIEDKEVLQFISLVKFDKNNIISTFKHGPLIPYSINEMILNNLLIEKVFYDVQKQISKIILSNKLILSGEIVWVNWLGDIGIVNILKRILKKKDFFINIDSNALWKSLFDYRKNNEYLYKISKNIFKSDLLFMNSIEIINGKKFAIEGSNNEMILSKDKYINVFFNSNNENFPKILVINDNEERSLTECQKRDFALDFGFNLKSTVVMGVEDMISYSPQSELNANFGFKINPLIKNKQIIQKGDVIGSFFKNITLVQNLKNKDFVLTGVQKQIIQKGDVIGYTTGLFGNRSIKAVTKGRLLLDFVKYGMILIEDKYPIQNLISPWSGVCLSYSNLDGYRILIDHIKIPLRYQMGNNVVAFKQKDWDFKFYKYIFFEKLVRECLSVKEIIEGDIKLIIIEQFEEPLFKKFIEKFPFILNYVSYAFISEIWEKRDLRIKALLNSDFIDSIVLDEGFLKIYCNQNSSVIKELKSQYATIAKNIVKTIGYKQNNIYGIIIKSLNSTEKEIKYDTEAVIESNSNLINLKYQL